MTTHAYAATLRWSGSTESYTAYDRTHTVEVPGAGQVQVSADPAFLGDANVLNPEQLVVMAAASCQMLSFLAVAARSRVVVTEYDDAAVGVMPEGDPPARITEITLTPRIRAVGADPAKVERLVRKAHEQCYVANSLTTRIVILPDIVVV